MIIENTILLALMPFVVWEMIWKGIGLWRSGRNNQVCWFVFIFFLNTLGLLPIIYLLFFQRKPKKVVARKKPKKRTKKRKRR